MVAANGTGARQNSTRHRQERADDPVEPGLLEFRMKLLEGDHDQHGHGERAEHELAALPVWRQRQPGPAQRRQHDQDRIFRDPVEHKGATRPAAMPPIVPPAAIQR